MSDAEKALSPDLEAMAKSLFERIAHGDDEHRAWLRQEARAWVADYFSERSVVTTEAA